MAQDVAGEIVAQLERSRVALVLHEEYSIEKGVSVRSADNGYHVKTYVTSDNLFLDRDGDEVFFTTPQSTAEYVYAVIKHIWTNPRRGLKLVYTPYPYATGVLTQHAVNVLSMHRTTQETSDNFTSFLELFLRTLKDARVSPFRV